MNAAQRLTKVRDIFSEFIVLIVNIARAPPLFGTNMQSQNEYFVSNRIHVLAGKVKPWLKIVLCPAYIYYASRQEMIWSKKSTFFILLEVFPKRGSDHRAVPNFFIWVGQACYLKYRK